MARMAVTVDKKVLHDVVEIAAESTAGEERDMFVGNECEY